jgi:hypothetical protein
LESIVPTFGVQILLLRERACFAMRVPHEYRDYSIDRSQGDRRFRQAPNESIDRNIAADAERNRK